jgi:formiminotetrahydrofolate cyclodeaminase
MTPKTITLEDLARMTQNGFIDMGQRIDNLRTELKQDIANVRVELSDVRDELKSDIKEIHRVLINHEDRLVDLEVE